MSYRKIALASLVAALSLSLQCVVADDTPTPQRRPNFIIIMADDMGYGDPTCYGGTIPTPNLDAMAKQGFKFDKAFCANSFCSACRASTLTGLMPSQHGVHSWIDDRNTEDWPAGWHALSGMATLPERLQSLGYKTGIFGKE